MRIPLLLVVSAAPLAFPASVRAEGTANRPTYEDVTASDSKLLGDCREQFYPMWDTRLVSDIPIQIMMSWLDGHRSIAPSAGLDVMGVWFTPVRPVCQQVAPGRATPQQVGLSWHFVGSGNVSATAMSSQETLQVTMPDPANPKVSLSQQTTVEKANVGAFLGGTVATYLNIRWFSGGHGNRVALGLLARYGYFIGESKQGSAVSLGLGLIITRD